MTVGEMILEKLKIRNLLALTISGIFGYVVYVVLNDPQLKENPVLMLILGGLISTINLVYVFYFRKAQSKESKP